MGGVLAKTAAPSVLSSGPRQQAGTQPTLWQQEGREPGPLEQVGDGTDGAGMASSQFMSPSMSPPTSLSGGGLR